MIITMELFAFAACFFCAPGMKLDCPFRERIAVSSALALALVLWLPYLLARAFGIGAGASLSLLLFALCAAAGGWHRIRSASGFCPAWRSVPRGSWRSGAILAFLAAAFMCLLYNSALRDRSGSLTSTGVGCEDMAIHATLANAFFRSHERIVHPTYPIQPDWPLGYPFLADFSAAAGMALGDSLSFAMFATAAFAAFALFSNLYCVTRRWFPPSLSGLAIFFFLFAGNAGFVLFLRDAAASGVSRVWLNDYAINSAFSLDYGNAATGVLLPMRTSLFGAPIALAAMLIFTRVPRPGVGEAMLAGFFLGSLPLINAHSLLAALLCLFVYVACDPARQLKGWVLSLLAAGLLASLQVSFIWRQVSGASTPFIRLNNGFLTYTPLSFPVYWLLNGGLFAPLACGVWFFADRRMKIAVAPFLLMLPLSMFVTFQPYAFDNIKLLVFFQIGGALLLAEFWRRSLMRGKWTAAAAFAASLACCASGMLSWIREAHISCEMAAPAERKFADYVIGQTGEKDLILTAQKFNHPVPFLTGRSIVLGFHNWMEQHGIPYRERAADVREIYAGTDRARALISKYGVTHIVVGPPERAEFPDLDEAFLASIAERAVSGDYRLYTINKR